MQPRPLTETCELRLTQPEFAEELFRLTDANRGYLRRWLPWPDHIKEVAHTEAFIRSQLDAYAKGESVHFCIFEKGMIIGVIAYNEIERATLTGQIGYWLGEACRGKGYMTMAVQALMEIGAEAFGLERFEIRCATDNQQSRAIPERLGFRHQCTIQRAEQVNEQWFDHMVYVKER
ncbi:MAG: GNAT family N-acetyltransferase [Verrucomicrobiota bacterium]